MWSKLPKLYAFWDELLVEKITVYKCSVTWYSQWAPGDKSLKTGS